MLKLFYVCFFITSGITTPFLPTYLRGLGLASSVTTVMSVAPLFHLGVPLVWGWIADRTRRPDLALRVACLGAAVALVPVINARALPALLAAYAVHQIFAVPIMGLADSLAVDRMRRTGEDYTRVRLWGSASFVVVCGVMGGLLALRARPGGDPIVPIGMAVGFALAGLAAFGLRGEPGRAPPHWRDLPALRHNRRLLFILVLGPLQWSTLTPYHAYLGILALDRGFPHWVVGAAFVVAVFAEVMAFALFPRLHRQYSLPALFAFVAVVGMVRWPLVAGVPFGPLGPVPMVALQALHFASFGVFWAGAMAWLAEAVPPALRATGQALFTAFTLGVGNLAGFAACGALHRRTGGTEAAFLAAAALEVIPLAMALFAWRHMHRRLSPGGPTS